MKENRIKAIKITGICFAVLAAVFMIVIMFFLLAFFGAFGYDVQSLTLSYEEAQNVQFDLPFVKRPEGKNKRAALCCQRPGPQPQKSRPRPGGSRQKEQKRRDQVFPGMAPQLALCPPALNGPFPFQDHGAYGALQGGKRRRPDI